MCFLEPRQLRNTSLTTTDRLTIGVKIAEDSHTSISSFFALEQGTKHAPSACQDHPKIVLTTFRAGMIATRANHGAPHTLMKMRTGSNTFTMA